MFFPAAAETGRYIFYIRNGLNNVFFPVPSKNEKTVTLWIALSEHKAEEYYKINLRIFLNCDKPYNVVKLTSFLHKFYLFEVVS